MALDQAQGALSAVNQTDVAPSEASREPPADAQQPSSAKDRADQSLMQLNQSRLDLQRQMAKIQEGLDRRKSMPFDPVLMAVASKILTPSRGGSAFEAFGAAGEAAVTAQEKEYERQQQEEKLKLELAQKQQEMFRQNIMLNDYLNRNQRPIEGALRGTPEAPLKGGVELPSIPSAAGDTGGAGGWVKTSLHQG